MGKNQEGRRFFEEIPDVWEACYIFNHRCQVSSVSMLPKFREKVCNRHTLEALHICVDETTKSVRGQRGDSRDETCILQHWVRDRMKNWWFFRPRRRSQWNRKKQKTRKYFREEGVVNCQMLQRSKKKIRAEKWPLSLTTRTWVWASSGT